MAKYVSIVVGKAKGSAGNATFSKCFGIPYFKQKPESVANPNTSGQQNQRRKITMLLNMFRLAASFIRQSFKNSAVGKGSYNAFVSANSKSENAAINAAGVIQPAYFKVSKGTVAIGTGVVKAAASGRDIEVSFDDNSTDYNAAATDTAYVVAVKTDGTEFYVSDSEINRTEGSQTITIPGASALNTFAIYLCFVNASMDNASNSQYLGMAA